MSMAQVRETSVPIGWSGELAWTTRTFRVAVLKALASFCRYDVVADLGAAGLVAASVVPVLAALLVAVAHLNLADGMTDSSSDPTRALVGNLLVSWLVVALPCTLLGLGRARSVNRSAFEKIQSRLTEVRAWSEAPDSQDCPSAEGGFCRATPHNALENHLSEVRSGLDKPGIGWVLGTGYIAIWRRLNAAEALLAYVEPLEQVSTRAFRLSARIAESSMPRAAAMEATLSDARRAATRNGKSTQAGVAKASSRGRIPTKMSETDIRAAVCEIQFAVNEFRTDRYAGLVQARNLLLGASALAGVALYGLVWLVRSAMGPHEALISWGLAFYLVGALVGILNVLYNQAGIDCSVEDYSLSTARVLVTPQLAGIAALIGVLVTASTVTTQVDAKSASDVANQFLRPVNFLAAAGFALSPGVLLSGLRKKTEDYKQDLKSSRAIGRHPG